MDRELVGTGGGQSTASPEPTTAESDFETAQRELFEGVGLDARSRYVDLASPPVRTHVFEAGPTADDGAGHRDGGPPLLFVHGGAAFGAFLAPLMAQLDDDRVIGFDRPGYGSSGGFRYTEGNLRRTNVDVIEGVLDEVGVERVDLVGHSMGGYASTVFALARPDRVRRLVLVGACAGFPGASPPTPLRLMTVPGLRRVLLRMAKPGEEGVLDVAEVFGEREAIQRYPAIVRAMAAEVSDPKSSTAGTSELSAFFSIRGWHPSIRLHEDDLRGITQPTLVIWGEDDPIGSPDDVRDGVEAIPDVRFETTPTAHAPFLSRPDRCAALIRAFREP